MRNMTVLIGAAAVFAVGVLTSVAMADEIPKPIVNLKTFDCRTFLKLPGDQRRSVILFYHGYISGQKGEVSVNIDKLAQATDRILDRCISKPSETLLTTFSASR